MKRPPQWPTCSPEQVRAKTRELLLELDALVSRHGDIRWVPVIRALAEELSELASSAAVDPAALETFATRAGTLIRENSIKGFDSLIWMAEDLEHVATKSI